MSRPLELRHDEAWWGPGHTQMKSRIKNRITEQFPGTRGFVFSMHEKFLVTCYHSLISAPPLTTISTIASYPHRCSSAGWDGSQGDSDRCGRSGCSHTLHDHKCSCLAYIHLSLLQGGNTEWTSFIYEYMSTHIHAHLCL